MEAYTQLNENPVTPTENELPSKSKFPWVLIVGVMGALAGMIVLSLFWFGLQQQSDHENEVVSELPTPISLTPQVRQRSLGVSLVESIGLQTDKSVFISPFSLKQALGMVKHGARGESRQEMDSILGEVATVGAMPRVDEVTLEVANSIWINEAVAPMDKQLNPQYVTDLKSMFGAFVGAIDSRQEVSGKKVNLWVAQATKNKITKIVEDEVNPATIMYLVDAVYFKGLWGPDYEFDVEKTKTGMFKNTSGKLEEVSMMEQENSFLYQENAKWQGVRLPYGLTGKAYAVFYLPKDADLTNLDLSELNDNGFSNRRGKLILPKFKLESAYELSNTLKQLGMKTVFSSEANFEGGMILPGSMPIQLSEVLHKTFVEVNESGTEAAAATAVLPVAGGGVDENELPFVMELNRPFVMMIKHDGIDAPLFMGIIRSIKN